MTLGALKPWVSGWRNCGEGEHHDDDDGDDDDDDDDARIPPIEKKDGDEKMITSKA